MILRGHIGITRSSDRTIHIAIEDADSSTRFVEVEMSAEAFGECVTGLHSECTLDVGGLQNVGKIRENKTELCERVEGYKPTDAQLTACVAPFEVDGWRAYRNDITNPHRFRGDKVAVTFERWVDRPDES